VPASLVEERPRVVALVRPPLSTFELACAAEVFGLERPGVPNRYVFSICAEVPGPVHTRAGVDVVVKHGLELLRTADTVVVSGWPLDEQPGAAVLEAVRAAHGRGARIAALCSGTFLLAAAGLLDGREATTHWRMAEQLQATYPAVRVNPKVLYVDHGDVATSAGTAAAIDLCLHLVRTDHGALFASEVARHMVTPPHRDGGQTQYATVPATPSGTSLAELTDWALTRLAHPLTVEDLARRARLGSRTLARRFRDELGVSPGRWLLRQRLLRACTLLEETDLAVDVIARKVGLSTEGNLRRRFRAEFETTPSAYRRVFRIASAARPQPTTT
jgi:AraC family transcriptional activator FtrA